jgi:electron transfer flavoprotein alpha subunit
MAGMSSSDLIISINNDKDAQIFEVAHYGFVGDLYEIVPKLIENLKRRK